MFSHRNAVRSGHPGAVAEYRVTMSQWPIRQAGYWAVVSHHDGMNLLLGRGETEAAAWEAAAEVVRMDGLLATVDY